jgi:uroporphyrinogen decarboxylase
MAQTKRELLQAALDGRAVDRVPVGFWFHFLAHPEQSDSLTDKENLRKNIDGHRSFYEGFLPDFVKLMSDGYFLYPHPELKKVRRAADFSSLQPLGDKHPWIEAQVALVKQLQQIFGKEVFTFYNIFAPARVLEWSLPDYTKTLLGDFIAEDKAAVKKGLDVIADDIASLAEKVIADGGADGIYFSVQNIEDKRVTQEIYEQVIAPGEQKILRAANAVSKNNILHICGYEGHHNDLSWYTDYDAKAYNWAVKVENIPLEQGKKLFKGRTVLGGFSNTENDILYKGDKETIQAETRRLLKNAGSSGIILGADCTVPSNIALEHLNWVREAAHS